jgi:hypothetical protein
LQIVGSVVIPGKHRKVKALCRSCGRIALLSVDNLLSGRTKNCQCQRGLKYARDPRAAVLGDRYDAILQRTTNPESRYWPNYGGRGIKLKFSSRTHFIEWCLKHLPHPTYKSVQIDRQNNNGNYEPGNLRLVSQLQNLTNKRTSVKVPFRSVLINAQHIWHVLKTMYPWFPFGSEWTSKLARRGMSGDEILKLGRERRAEGWHGSTTSETVDPEVVKLYRERLTQTSMGGGMF